MGKYWTDKTDNQDEILAEDFNDAFDAIEADIESKASTTTLETDISEMNEAIASLNANVSNKASKDEVYTKSESDNRYLPKNTVIAVSPDANLAIENEALNYRIYGKSVQSGTPTSSSPIEVVSVGDLVESGTHQGEYKIETYVTHNNTAATVSAFLSKPLLSCDTYYDYIDYEKQKVVRKTKETIYTGVEDWKLESTTSTLAVFRLANSGYTACNALSNRFVYNGSTERITISSTGTMYIKVLKTIASTADEFKTALSGWNTAGSPLKVYGVIPAETQEDVSLNAFELKDGSNNIEVNTNISPSKVEVTYYQNPTDVINDLRTAIVALQSETE